MPEMTFGQTLPEWSQQAVSDQLRGYCAARRNATSAHQRRVNEAARVYADCLQGRLDPIFMREAINPRNEVLVAHLMEKYPRLYPVGLRETMAVTDYQALYVDVLDRLYYGYYNAYPIVNKPLVKVKTLRDFRTVKRYMNDGMVTPLSWSDPAAPAAQRSLVGPVPQDGATEAAAGTAAAITYAPLLGQAMASINWPAFVNDDLGIFQDVSQRLAIAANRAISKLITGLYVDTAGPNALLYKAGYRNLITTTYGASADNPQLDSQGVMDALKILAMMRDEGGDPIAITGRMILWYGPALTAVAQNLKRALSLFVNTEGGKVNSSAGGYPFQQLQVANWIADMDLVMDPYIPIVCTTTTVRNTMWGITVDPNSQNRPNSEVGFLNGYETPQLFSKLPNTQRLGGGVESMLGDFYTLDQDVKVVTVMGGTQIDGRSTVASKGTGSA